MFRAPVYARLLNLDNHLNTALLDGSARIPTAERACFSIFPTCDQFSHERQQPRA